MKLSLRRILVSFFSVLIAFTISIVGLFSFLRFTYPFEYKEEIYEYSDQYSVDPLLVAAMIHVESNFRETAESRRGARGLMQVMPDTGRWIASQVGLVDFDDNMLFDPEVNIMLGVWYISSLMREFNSELPLALAAYNAGKGNVSVWLREGRWSGKAEDIDSIPFPETRGYIERVIKTHWWYSLLYKSRFRLWKRQS